MKYWITLLLLAVPLGADMPGFAELVEEGLSGTASRPLETEAPARTSRDPSEAMDRLALRYMGQRDVHLASPRLDFIPDFRVNLSMESIRKWSRIILTEAGERSPVREIRYSVSGERIVVHVLTELSFITEHLDLQNPGLAFGPGEIFKAPEHRVASATNTRSQLAILTAGLGFPGQMSSSSNQPGVLYLDPPNPQIRIVHEQDLTSYARLLQQRQTREAQMETASRSEFREMADQVMEMDARIERFEGSAAPFTASAELVSVILDELNQRGAFGEFIQVAADDETIQISHVDREIFQYVQVPLIFNFAGIVNKNNQPTLSLAGTLGRR